MCACTGVHVCVYVLHVHSLSMLLYFWYLFIHVQLTLFSCSFSASFHLQVRPLFSQSPSFSSPYFFLAFVVRLFSSCHSLLTITLFPYCAAHHHMSVMVDSLFSDCGEMWVPSWPYGVTGPFGPMFGGKRRRTLILLC